MRRLARWVQPIAMSLLVAHVAAVVVAPVCPMGRPSARTSAVGVDDEHDCCKAGFSGAKPSCCHAASTATPLALPKSGSAIGQPCSVTAALLSSGPAIATAVASAPVACLSHGPPATVLRI